MPVPLLAIGISTLFCGALFAKSARDKRRPIDPVIAAERTMLYDTAINNSKPKPDHLREMAKIFRREGHTAEAMMLEKRADLAEAPPEVKAQRNKWLKQGLTQTDPEIVRELAEAFDEMGASGCANRLRAHAIGLEAAKEQDEEEKAEGVTDATDESS